VCAVVDMRVGLWVQIKYTCFRDCSQKHISPSRKRWHMATVVAFLCRLSVFALLSVCSTFAARTYELDLYSRLLVSSLQILIFCAALAMYEVCICLLTGMRSVDVYRSVEEERGSQEMPGVDLESDTQVPVSDEVISVISQAPTEKIVFTNSRDLRGHMWSVYLLGVLTWVSIFCLDFTMLSASFFFTIGLLGGWVILSCSRASENTSSKLLRVFYFVSMTLLVALYVSSHRQILDPNTQFASRDAVIAVIVPFLAGLGWMHMPRTELTGSLQTSFFTCCLLCLPHLFIIDTSQFRAIFDAAPKGVIVYLLIVEPLLKAMAIYTIALSLQTGRRLDLLIVLLFVVHLDDALFYGHQAMRAVTVTAMVVLVSVHSVCLVAVSSR